MDRRTLSSILAPSRHRQHLSQYSIWSTGHHFRPSLRNERMTAAPGAWIVPRSLPGIPGHVSRRRRRDNNLEPETWTAPPPTNSRFLVCNNFVWLVHQRKCRHLGNQTFCHQMATSGHTSFAQNRYCVSNLTNNKRVTRPNKLFVSIKNTVFILSVILIDPFITLLKDLLLNQGVTTKQLRKIMTS